MSDRRERKIVLVSRRTRLEELLKRFNTRGQVRFYLEHSGDDWQDYFTEHDQYQEGLAECKLKLAQFGKLQTLDRSFLPNYLFAPDDLVVVYGQDGLVCNTLKYLDRLPVIGVNPDPRRWDGVLLPFRAADLEKIIPEQLAGKRPLSEVTMAEIRLNTGERLLGVNDLFIGPRSHGSARYLLETGSRSEEQLSSGIIVSTGMGSTGWLKSLYAGALQMAAGINGQKFTSKKKPVDSRFPRNAEHLLFTVREPFASRTTQAELVFGRIAKQEKLRLVSRMSSNGVIFSDGIEQDYLDFNSGAEALIGLAPERGLLVE